MSLPRQDRSLWHGHSCPPPLKLILLLHLWDEHSCPSKTGDLVRISGASSRSPALSPAGRGSSRGAPKLWNGHDWVPHPCRVLCDRVGLLNVSSTPRSFFVARTLLPTAFEVDFALAFVGRARKSTRLNFSHMSN